MGNKFKWDVKVVIKKLSPHPHLHLPPKPYLFFFDKVSIIENMKTLDYDKYVTYYNAFYLT